MTALMGIPILGELPSATDWMAIVLISIGVYVVSGGPLPGQIVGPSLSTGRGWMGHLPLTRLRSPKRQASAAAFGAKPGRSDSSVISSERRP